MHSNQLGAGPHYNRSMRRAMLMALPVTQNFYYSEATVQSLTGCMFRLLNELVFLNELERARKPGKVPYAWCRQSYLAKKVGCCREHVNRCLKVMASMGMIFKIWRRPTHGHYNTCLYFVTRWARWQVAKVINALTKVKRVINTSQKCTPSISNERPLGLERAKFDVGKQI